MTKYGSLDTRPLTHSQYAQTTKRLARFGTNTPALDYASEKNDLQSLCCDGKVDHQIKGIDSLSIPWSIEVNLPVGNVLELLKVPLQSGEYDGVRPWRFKFPVAISDDLRSFLVLRTLTALQPLETGKGFGHS